MDLGFLKLGWTRFGFDISIQPIPLPFKANNYSNIILAKKFIFSVNRCVFLPKHGFCKFFIQHSLNTKTPLLSKNKNTKVPFRSQKVPRIEKNIKENDFSHVWFQSEKI